MLPYLLRDIQQKEVVLAAGRHYEDVPLPAPHWPALCGPPEEQAGLRVLLAEVGVRHHLPAHRWVHCSHQQIAYQEID